MVWSNQLSLAADGFQECECRAIGREQKVIAIVDCEPERRLEIGAAAAASVACKLVQNDLAPGAN
jgi:hypothetical protein